MSDSHAKDDGGKKSGGGGKSHNPLGSAAGQMTGLFAILFTGLFDNGGG
jgi:hypothetical protein